MPTNSSESAIHHVIVDEALYIEFEPVETFCDHEQKFNYTGGTVIKPDGREWILLEGDLLDYGIYLDLR